MEKRLFFIFILFFTVTLFSQQAGFPLVQDSFNLMGIQSESTPYEKKIPFGDTAGRILRFYPPLSSEEAPFWQMTLSGNSGGSLVFLFDQDEITIHLPVFQDRTSLSLILPEKALLQGVVVPPSMAAESRDISFSRESFPSSSLTVNLEDASVLEYTLPASHRNRLLYFLEITSRELISIEGPHMDPFRLKPRKNGQAITLLPDEESAEVWRLSPLSAVDSLSFKAEPVPPFPTPLTEDMVEILTAPREKWRNPDFEVYRWCGFPDILVWDCLDYAVQNRFFRRLSYYVEKKGFRGNLLTNRELEGRHGWNAHDYRAEDLADFFQLAEDLDFPLYREEWLMRDILLENGFIIRDKKGTIQEGEGAIISISRESPDFLRERFLVHEASHGLYFTKPEYREFITSVWQGLPDQDKKLWRFFLGWYGYDPEDEDLMINEFQAYSIQQPADQASEYFNTRLTRLTGLYPEQKDLLAEGTGENSGKFQTWSSLLGDWLLEKWGLESGDFFPLNKEL